MISRRLVKVPGCLLMLVLIGNLCDVPVRADTLRTTPIVSTRGHFKDTAFVGVSLTKHHTANDFDTTGDIPGMEKGSCPEEIVIYVHGFENSTDEAIGNFNLAKKSLALNGYSFPVIGFSWDSKQGGLDFKDADTIATMNGKKLAQFIYQFKCKCPDTKIRLVSHSLGARVVLNALQVLNDFNKAIVVFKKAMNSKTVKKIQDKLTIVRCCLLKTKIQSVALLAAAVDNEEVETSKGHFGQAIENVVEGNFWNYWNSEDNTLSGLYALGFISSGGISIDQALGEAGIEDKSKEPKNYRQRDVTKEVGDDHSGYNGPTTDKDVTEDINKGAKADGVMDKVKSNWDKELSKKFTSEGSSVQGVILSNRVELCPDETNVPHFSQKVEIGGTFVPVAPTKEFIDSVAKGRKRSEKDLGGGTCITLPIVGQVCQACTVVDTIPGVRFELAPESTEFDGMKSTKLPKGLELDPETGALVSFQDTGIDIGTFKPLIRAVDTKDKRVLAELWIDLTVGPIIKITISPPSTTPSTPPSGGGDTTTKTPGSGGDTATGGNSCAGFKVNAGPDQSFTFNNRPLFIDVQFSGSAIGATDITSWKWNFGDTKSAIGQSLSHRYNVCGGSLNFPSFVSPPQDKKTVTLTVTDKNCGTRTDTLVVRFKFNVPTGGGGNF